MVGVLIYGIGFLISSVLCSAMLYQEEMSRYVKSWRESLGASIVTGTWVSVLWPLGLPITYVMTGFAEHGIWRQK